MNQYILITLQILHCNVTAIEINSKNKFHKENA